MTNTEQLTESLERLEQMRLAFKTGNVSMYGVDAVIAEVMKVLRILIEERCDHSMDSKTSEVSALVGQPSKRYSKGKHEGGTSREPLNGSSPKG